MIGSVYRLLDTILLILTLYSAYVAIYLMGVYQMVRLRRPPDLKDLSPLADSLYAGVSRDWTYSNCWLTRV
jgi:hypothetical protein